MGGFRLGVPRDVWRLSGATWFFLLEIFHGFLTPGSFEVPWHWMYVLDVCAGHPLIDVQVKNSICICFNTYISPLLYLPLVREEQLKPRLGQGFKWVGSVPDGWSKDHAKIAALRIRPPLGIGVG